MLLSAHAKTDSVTRMRNFVQAFHVSSTCCNSHALKSIQKMQQIVLILLMKCLSAVLQKCTSAENKKIQIIVSRKTLYYIYYIYIYFFVVHRIALTRKGQQDNIQQSIDIKSMFYVTKNLDIENSQKNLHH